MKKVTLVLFSFFAFGMSVHAQSIFDKAAEDAAIVICNCVNKAYKSVDEIVADEDGSKGKIFEECMDSNTEKMKKKYDNLEQQPGFQKK